MRNRRISEAVIGIAIAVLGLAGLTWILGVGQPTDERAPTTPPKPPGIFSEVGGWITYTNHRGIFAVDPAQPANPHDQIRLSPNEGWPVAWSPDGSKLLILRQVPDSEPGGFGESDLFVLHADGTETRLTEANGWVTGGSFSPDGTQVIYAVLGDTAPSSIFAVDAGGGTPEVLLTAGRRYFFADLDRSFRTELYYPTLSPGGTQIAYFDGLGDSHHTIWLMNADGGNPRVLLDDPLLQRPGHIGSLVWSRDGTRLAFYARISWQDSEGFSRTGIYTVRVDGSELTLVIPGGSRLHWSADGYRISYQLGDELSGSLLPLQIAATDEITGPLLPLENTAADGSRVQKFGYAGSGPWNPLAPLESSVAEAPTANEGLTLASMLLLLAGLLTLHLGTVLFRRRMRKTGSA